MDYYRSTQEENDPISKGILTEVIFNFRLKWSWLNCSNTADRQFVQRTRKWFWRLGFIVF